MKLCKNCKFYSERKTVFNCMIYICKRNIIYITKISPVTGEMKKERQGTYLDCEEERSLNQRNSCGAEGKHYIGKIGEE